MCRVRGGAGLVRVVIADDSAVQRRFVRRALEEAGIEVVGEARHGVEAVDLVEVLAPDVLVLDLEMPVLSGLGAIERLMAVRPLPIVVYTVHAAERGSPAAAAAVAAGAVAVLGKPDATEVGGIERQGRELAERVRLAARATVITHPRGRLDPGHFDDAPAGPALRAVGLAASSGGPQALARILADLPVSFPAPVLVVQHLPPGFGAGLVGVLARDCPLGVAMARDAELPGPGEVRVAPPGYHLAVRPGGRLRLRPADPGERLVPSADVLLFSLAAAYGAACAGVLLTGMGSDGAEGLAAIRRGGGLTIAQDQATSAVFGMPAAAVAIGAAERVLPLDEIGAAVAGAAADRRRAVGWLA